MRHVGTFIAVSVVFKPSKPGGSHPPGFTRFRGRPMTREEFHPPLDEGIADAVIALRAAGVETFESCQGGDGHSYPEPTVRFHGDRAEGFRALAVALQSGLKVASLRRAWPVLDGEPTGPWWELTFTAPEKLSGKAG